MAAEEVTAGSNSTAADKVPPSAQTSFDPSLQPRWSHLETVRLIKSYAEKWTSLKRRRLKARHWEEVANDVFLRYGGSQPSKSSAQCQHKMEKLRKRYREEKGLQEQKRTASTWPYFQLIDAMEQGIRGSKSAKFASATMEPLAGNGTVRRSARVRLKWPDQRDHMNAIPASLPRLKTSGPSKEHAAHFVKHSSRSDLQQKLLKACEEHETEATRENDMFSKQMRTELASVIRSLGEGFLRIEQMKLEMQRDNEKLRAELELKRTSMFLNSEKQIAEMLAKALTGKKGIKKRQLQEL